MPTKWTTYNATCWAALIAQQLQRTSPVTLLPPQSSSPQRYSSPYERPSATAASAHSGIGNLHEAVMQKIYL